METFRQQLSGVLETAAAQSLKDMGSTKGFPAKTHSSFEKFCMQKQFSMTINNCSFSFPLTNAMIIKKKSSLKVIVLHYEWIQINELSSLILSNASQYLKMICRHDFLHQTSSTREQFNATRASASTSNSIDRTKAL